MMQSSTCAIDAVTERLMLTKESVVMDCAKIFSDYTRL